MKVRFKKLNPNAVIPSYAKEGDAGLDLTAVNFTPSSEFYEYDTGLAAEIPYGYVGLIFPRSSISKTEHLLANAVGVLDSGYRGNIRLRMKNLKNGTNVYSSGDKVGQLLILPFPFIEPEEAETLSETVRGTDGFGSTGT